MNITKNNIERQIKKQIEEREIAPSRDLWSEIENQSAAKTLKSSFNWLLIAACLILTLSLGVVLFFNQENKPAKQSEIVVQVTNPAIQSPVKDVAQKQLTETAKDQEQKMTAGGNIAADKSNLQEQKSQTFTPQEELLAIKQNSAQIISDISPIKQGKTIAQADSAKVEVRKKKYVDPSTLLFSVEHKEVIEKTKGKSNVATIDLNGN